MIYSTLYVLLQPKCTTSKKENDAPVEATNYKESNLEFDFML